MKRVLLIIFSIIPFLSIAQIECSYDTIVNIDTTNLSSNKHIKIIANNRVWFDNDISINSLGNSEFSIEIEECIEFSIDKEKINNN